MTNAFPPEPAPGLLERASTGDEAAFAELYRLYAGRVYTLALRAALAQLPATSRAVTGVA